MKMSHRLLGSLALAFAFAATPAFAEDGVTPTEVTFGAHLVLSGPLAELGARQQDAMRLVIDEVNEKGGIHGRKIKVIVEDSAYDVKKAVLATQKFIESDKVLAVIMATGSEPAIAAMPILHKAGVPNLFPLAPAAAFVEPFNRLNFAYFTPNGVIVRPGVEYFAAKGKKKFCVLYQDDAYGEEVIEGTTKQLAKHNLKIVDQIAYKRGATDFSAQVAKLKQSDCDMLIAATVPQSLAAAMAEVRRRDWNVDVMAGGPAYDAAVATLGKEAVEGVYTVGFYPIPDPETGSPEVKAWIAKYQAKYGKVPPVYASYATGITEIIMEGLRKAGPNLTRETLISGLENVRNFKLIFGPTVNMSATNHLALSGANLFQIKGGKWTLVQPDMNY